MSGAGPLKEVFSDKTKLNANRRHNASMETLDPISHYSTQWETVKFLVCLQEGRLNTSQS